MKKSTTNVITTIMAIVLFLFGLAAFWFEKMDGLMLLPVSIASIALISLKNEPLKKFIYAILKIKE